MCIHAMTMAPALENHGSPFAVAWANRDPATTKGLTRAMAYPYPRPTESYLFRDGEAHQLPEGNFPGLHFVLAIGSNAAPCQLRRKYGATVSIPVLAIQIEGLDVVFAALMSSYGSVPATVMKSEGTVLNVHATLLNDEQLSRMHETEGGYYFTRLRHGKGVRVLRDGVPVESAFVYVAKPGALCNGQVHGLAEIDATGRKHPAIEQRAMQTIVKEFIGRNEEVDEFVLKNIADKSRRDQAMGKMKGMGIVDDCFEIVEGIESVLTAGK